MNNWYPVRMLPIPPYDHGYIVWDGVTRDYIIAFIEDGAWAIPGRVVDQDHQERFEWHYPPEPP